MGFDLKPIGFIKTIYQRREDCPRQADPDSPPASLVIDKKFLDGIRMLTPGDELIVLTWLHLGRRDVLLCHPRGDRSLPLHGVFATRSPDRPNPIGFHVVKLLDIKDNILVIHPIEVVDNTPVVDIKPFKLKGAGHISLEELKLFQEVGYRAWQKGLLSGFGGNISIRKKDGMIITRSKISKGYLDIEDIGFLSFDEDFKSKGFSIESLLHIKVYQNQPKANAILHTHPTYLLALSLSQKDKKLFEDLPLFEAKFFLPLFTQIPPIEPGSKELAEEVAKASVDYKAIFLENHGLVCWEEDLKKALALSEEIENLAKISFLIKNKEGEL